MSAAEAWKGVTPKFARAARKAARERPAISAARPCDNMRSSYHFTAAARRISLAKSPGSLRNAASEPHVQGLCRLLLNMGAKIEGLGSNTLHIQGGSRLHGATHRVGADYQEIGSFISLAAVTGGELFIQEADCADLRMIRNVFSRLGIETVARDKAEGMFTK